MPNQASYKHLVCYATFICLSAMINDVTKVYGKEAKNNYSN
jgi:hypothetical protein